MGGRGAPDRGRTGGTISLARCRAITLARELAIPSGVRVTRVGGTIEDKALTSPTPALQRLLHVRSGAVLVVRSTQLRFGYARGASGHAGTTGAAGRDCAGGHDGSQALPGRPGGPGAAGRPGCRVDGGAVLIDHGGAATFVGVECGDDIAGAGAGGAGGFGGRGGSGGDSGSVLASGRAATGRRWVRRDRRCGGRCPRGRPLPPGHPPRRVFDLAAGPGSGGSGRVRRRQLRSDRWERRCRRPQRVRRRRAGDPRAGWRRRRWGRPHRSGGAEGQRRRRGGWARGCQRGNGGPGGRAFGGALLNVGTITLRHLTDQRNVVRAAVRPASAAGGRRTAGWTWNRWRAATTVASVARRRPRAVGRGWHASAAPRPGRGGRHRCPRDRTDLGPSVVTMRPRALLVHPIGRAGAPAGSGCRSRHRPTL